MDAVKNFMIGLMYENGGPSLTRTLSVVAFLAFLAGSAYLMLSGHQWAHYETFATVTGGGGLAGQVTNKFVNTKYGGNGQ